MIGISSRWEALRTAGAHLEDLCGRASAVGECHVSELHLPIHVVWGQRPIVHHRWLAVDELEHLLSSSHPLHQATVDGAHGLEGKKQQGNPLT